MLTSLPVLLYHYTGKKKDPISVPPELFEAHLLAMTRAGYKGIGLDEATAYLLDGKPLPKKSVLITFDDGFLDNFLYAYPLLKEHGHKAVIFAAAGKIEERAPRPTLADVRAGDVSETELPKLDSENNVDSLGYRERRDPFFSWDEARVMEESGVISVAAHTMFHESVFLGPDFEDFFCPGPRRRTFDRVATPVVMGLPRFPKGPAMSNRAFLPSDEILTLAQSMVPQSLAEADAFFTDSKQVENLRRAMEAIPSNRRGRMETNTEYMERVRKELSDCKALLEKELGGSRTAIAWPWGAYNEDVLQIAREVGFRLFFTTAVGSNPPARTASHIHRFKAKAKPPGWLKSRLFIYSRPLLSKIYAVLRKL